MISNRNLKRTQISVSVVKNLSKMAEKRGLKP